MLKRFSIGILLAIQAIGGGAITLAHARDVVAAAPGFEARHDGRCAILHDEVRCALGHYASARILPPARLIVPAPAETLRFTPVQPTFSVAAVVRLTSPARAPPSHLS